MANWYWYTGLSYPQTCIVPLSNFWIVETKIFGRFSMRERNSTSIQILKTDVEFLEKNFDEVCCPTKTAKLSAALEITKAYLRNVGVLVE